MSSKRLGVLSDDAAAEVAAVLGLSDDETAAAIVRAASASMARTVEEGGE